jgi:DNA-binding beta-propeller fold protein YncE
MHSRRLPIKGVPMIERKARDSTTPRATRKPLGWPGVAAAILALGGCAGGLPEGGAILASQGPGGADESLANPSTADYWVYVGAESADKLHRVRFGPEGAVVERTTPVGRIPTETEGPHGVAVSPDGRHVYMTTGHGIPDGMLWKYEAGLDRLVAEPILLGRFPATLDVGVDGLYIFVVNFNLHGEHVPSTMSVVYGPELFEVEQIELCTMPHGVRVDPDGEYVYTVCMMDDQLVEVDAFSFAVSRRFSVAPGREGPLPADQVAAHDHHDHPAPAHGRGIDHTECSPTWAHPAPGSLSVYVACNASDRIQEIDVRSWELRRTLTTGRGPYNLDFTPDGRILIATLKQGDAVEFFDTESGESLARVGTSTRVVHGVAVSPDGRYAFVTVEGVGREPGKVDIFDLSTFERVAEVEVGQQAAGIAFWKMENR